MLIWFIVLFLDHPCLVRLVDYLPFVTGGTGRLYCTLGFGLTIFCCLFFGYFFKIGEGSASLFPSKAICFNAFWIVSPFNTVGKLLFAIFLTHAKYLKLLVLTHLCPYRPELVSLLVSTELCLYPLQNMSSSYSISRNDNAINLDQHTNLQLRGNPTIRGSHLFAE